MNLAVFKLRETVIVNIYNLRWYIWYYAKLYIDWNKRNPNYFSQYECTKCKSQKYAVFKWIQILIYI